MAIHTESSRSTLANQVTQVPTWLRWGAVAVAALAFLTLFLRISPQYNFPSNDDHFYARSVQYLVEEGQLRISLLVDASVQFHILWGALFAFIFGFGYTALRLATLTLSVGGLAAFYQMIRDLGFSRRKAWLAVAAVGLNPLYFYLSFTFMTDVPFTGLMLISLFCAVRWVQGRGWVYALATGVIASCAILTRQLGLMLPMALGLYLIVARPGGWRHTLLAGLPAIALPVLVLAWYVVIGNTLTRGYATELAYQSAQITVDPATAMGGLGQIAPRPAYFSDMLDFWFGSIEGVRSLARRIPFTLEYQAWFVIPLLFAVLPGAWRALAGQRRRSWLILAGITFVITVLHILYNYRVAHTGLPWQYGISRFGIHPNLVGPPGPNRAQILPQAFWQVLTFLTPLPAAALGAIYLQRLRTFLSHWRRWQPVDLVYLTGLAFLAITFISPEFFDRYLIVLIPYSAFAVLELPWRKAVGSWQLGQLVLILVVAATLGLAVFSVLNLQDYLAWNQARWAAGQKLIQSGIPASHIRGGFEWDADQFYHEGIKTVLAEGQQGEIFWNVWKKYVVPDYQIAFTPQPGYQIIDYVPYRSLLFASRPQAILILQRQP